MKAKKQKARVWLYARFSTDGQMEGTSIDVQRSQFVAICAAQGLSPTALVVDATTSGSIPLFKRTFGGRMLARLRKGDAVLGLKLDRMFRNAADCLDVAAEFERRGVRLHLHDLGGFMTGTAEAQFRRTIFAGVAQFERARCSTRIRESKAFLRSQGRFEGGSPPFAFAGGRAASARGTTVL